MNFMNCHQEYPILKRSQWQQQYAQRIAFVLGFERDSILFLFLFTPIQLIYPSQRHIWPKLWKIWSMFSIASPNIFSNCVPSVAKYGPYLILWFRQIMFSTIMFDLSFILLYFHCSVFYSLWPRRNKKCSFEKTLQKLFAQMPFASTRLTWR